MQQQQVPHAFSKVERRRRWDFDCYIIHPTKEHSKTAPSKSRKKPLQRPCGDFGFRTLIWRPSFLNQLRAEIAFNVNIGFTRLTGNSNLSEVSDWSTVWLNQFDVFLRTISEKKKPKVSNPETTEVGSLPATSTSPSSKSASLPPAYHLRHNLRKQPIQELQPDSFRLSLKQFSLQWHMGDDEGFQYQLKQHQQLTPYLLELNSSPLAGSHSSCTLQEIARIGCKLVVLHILLLNHLIYPFLMKLSASIDVSITFQGHIEKRDSKSRHFNFPIFCLVFTLIFFRSDLLSLQFLKFTIGYWHRKRSLAWNERYGKHSVVTPPHYKVLLTDSVALINQPSWSFNYESVYCDWLPHGTCVFYVEKSSGQYNALTTRTKIDQGKVLC